MSERKQLRAMLERRGIPFEDFVNSDEELVVKVEVPLVGGDQQKVDGYSGFYAEFIFDQAGVLKRVGVWE